jgi:hypothetical protein
MKRGAPGLPMYASHKMLELARALGFGTIAGPVTDGKEIFRLSASVGFEPFGRASESWDVVWTLTLPLVRLHVRMVDGWHVSPHPVPMTFTGRDDGECISRALQFLRDVPNPEPLRIMEARTQPTPTQAGALSARALDEEGDTT